MVQVERTDPITVRRNARFSRRIGHADRMGKNRHKLSTTPGASRVGILVVANTYELDSFESYRPRRVQPRV
jgi:hypothetical protein